MNVEAMTLPPHTKTFILVLSPGLPNNQDFFFQLLAQLNLILFSYLVDHTTSGILVCNEFQRAVHLFCKQKLELVIKVFYKNCFQAGSDLDAAEILPQATLLYESCQVIRISTVNPSLETKLPNDIRVYGNQVTVKRLSS